VPLLIGGATTSRRHTSIRIAPAYGGITTHVLDASRAVDVVGQLMSDGQRDRFTTQIRELQEADRQRHARGPARALLSHEDAAARRLRIDWSVTPPDVPAFTGSRSLRDFPLRELAGYIDWSPFFHTWELKGTYPAILDHPKFGPAARDLLRDGQALLERIIDGRLLTARGVYGFFPAAGVGDDIALYTDEKRNGELARFHTLRQQQEPSGEQPRLALSDFIAPPEAGRKDYLGAFAVTAGIGAEALVARFEKEHDDYHAIMARALADRLAEAFAERLHEMARGDWGYGASEKLSREDLLKERYRGIRPAAGYPACPDHSEKRTLWTLLDVERATSIRLTESCAMLPAASVSGLYFAHPEARYFAVGKIGRDQVAAYAARKGAPIEEVERWLMPVLAYEPRPARAGRAG
jgi:5-methyltetrahydrofolate--homocysteine methyltransferase